MAFTSIQWGELAFSDRETPERTMESMQVSSHPRGMLDEPAHLRQWVLRRLQRTRTVELWAASLRAGMARFRRGAGSGALADEARRSDERAAELAAIIEELDGVPYSQLGIARRLAGMVGALLGLLGGRLCRSVLRRVVTFTMTEYDSLAGLAHQGPGLPPDLADRLEALGAATAQELARLQQGARG